MKRYTISQQIEDLMKALNEFRVKNNKIPVRRGWTGAGHWLMTDEKDYKAIGSIYCNDKEFIGVLQGMMIEQ